MQVTVHNDAFPPDQEFEIPGLGLVTNHVGKTVDDSQIASFKAMGYTWPDTGDLVIDYSEPKAPIASTAVGSSDEEAPAAIASTDNEGDK